MGLLSTDLRHDFNATHLEPLAAAGAESLAAALEALETQGRQALAADAVDPARMRFVRQLDLRYVGQSYELGVEVDDARFPPEEVGRLGGRFHEEHERSYGFKAAAGAGGDRHHPPVGGRPDLKAGAAAAGGGRRRRPGGVPAGILRGVGGIRGLPGVRALRPRSGGPHRGSGGGAGAGLDDVAAPRDTAPRWTRSGIC